MYISVAMCTYNGERYIEEQLLSIINQSLCVDEIIIYDDCSSDKTLEIIERIIPDFPSIHFFVKRNEENLGFRKNFRQAIAKCKGEVIFISDQDDVWISTKVERTMQIFKENEDCLALISDFWAVDAKGTKIQKKGIVENIIVSNRVAYSNNTIDRINIYEGLMGSTGQGCATAINRQLANMYLNCPINWAHDHLVDCIAVLHNGLYFTKDKLFYYRIHGNNTIGMPLGKDNQRKTGFFTMLRETYGCLKYVVFQCDWEKCNSLVYDMGDYYVVEKYVDVDKNLIEELNKWRTIRSKRLQYLQQKKLLNLIFLRLKEPEYFKNAVSHYTYEQHLLCFLGEMGVVLKSSKN